MRRHVLLPALSLAVLPWTAGCGLIADALALVRASTVELPEEMREFGMTDLLSVMVVQWFADQPAGSEFGGVHTPAMFAVNDDGTQCVPVSTIALNTFDVEDAVQDDPDWQPWVESIRYSDPWSAVDDCSRG